MRLMSYLTPEKKEVGYSLTRARKEKGYSREKLPRFGRIPSHKATLLWLALRYGFIDKSILVVTEGFGPQKFHGRVVVLVNEHTASAGEMVAAFAEENGLATIVGTKTPGRLLSGSAFKAGFGYIVGLASCCLSDMGRKTDRRQGSVAEYPGWIVPGRASGRRRPSNAESIGTCARALTQVATQAVITQAIPCVPSRWI